MPADPTTLPALIAALREATVGSEHLNERIARALGWTGSPTLNDGTGGWKSPDGYRHMQARMWTWSLDTALTLVPAGETIRMWLTVGMPGAWASVDPLWQHNAATPALAMCCAALTARGAG